MEKLFDENNEFDELYYRTIWYGYIEGGLNDNLVKIIENKIRLDLSIPMENEPVATHWIFYNGTKSSDAIGEEVRNSIMVRLKEGMYIVNLSISDFSFVTEIDIVREFTGKLELKLNASFKK